MRRLTFCCFAVAISTSITMLGMHGCASFSTSISSGEFGATQGGVQDMGLARELVKSGRVPPDTAFVVEGMFSEHDLGLTGEECSRTLCLREAVGIAPMIGGQPGCWLQVGLSSMIDMDTFQRPDLTVVACIDVSGSMGWEYDPENKENITPGLVTRNLLSNIAGTLTEKDKIAIVTYGTTVNTVLTLRGGSDQQAIQAAIDSLSTGGVTDMEGGLRRAYDIARSDEAVNEQVRIMLFTDVQPNVGATGATDFEQIVADGAKDGIGLTVFGVGVGMRQELFNAMSHLRGGNAFSLFDNEDIVDLMADDWPWLISPIAYNLTLSLSPNAGFAGTAAYGFPSSEVEEGPSLDTATVFLSRRKGALLVGFNPDPGVELTSFRVTGQIAYETPSGETINEDITAELTNAIVDDQGRYFEQESVGKTVALALLVEGMAESARLYSSDRESAIESLKSTIARYSTELLRIDDEGLVLELNLANSMLELMEQGAEQGDFYGVF